MPNATRLGIFVAVTTVLLVTPGPAVLYVATRSVLNGRATGLVSAVGVGMGDLVHAVLGALGLSALIAASATGFLVVKVLGAAYLVGLGLAHLRSPRSEAHESPSPATSMRGAYMRGLIVGLVNPKTMLFFVAIVPQFVNRRQGGVGTQVLVLGLAFVLLGLCTDAAYALAASSLSARLRRVSRARRPGRNCLAALYLCLGISAAATGHASTK